MATRGLRIGIVGATGAVGTELLEVLGRSALPVREIVAVATERSLGAEVEFLGESHPVAAELDTRGLDFLFLCAPPAAALELARHALRAEVPCVDLSGALAGADPVPLRVAHVPFEAPAEGTPLVATPAGAALPLVLVLAPLARAAGLHRVTGTVLESASAAGRLGIESLSAETVSLFNQQEIPETRIFDRPVAFDCFTGGGASGAEGASEREESLARSLVRLLGDDVRIGVTLIQVPTFVGHGAALGVETRSEIDPKLASEILRGAPGVEVWEGATGPSTRAAAGRDVALVGRIRRDPSCDRGLLLWVAADVIHLAAVNAVELAEERLAVR